MKLSVKCLLILMCLGLPVAAQAACNRYPNSQNSVSFPSTITVPESLGVGQLITSQTFAGPYPTFYMYCHSPTPTFLTGRFSTAVSAPGGLIYHTNVPGIGMRVMVTLTSGAPYSAKLRTESLVSAPGNILWGATRLVAQFYKLGPVTTGTLPSGEIQHNNWDGGKGHYRMILNTSIRFVNPATTCDLATGDVNRTITLPTVRVSDFNNGVNTGARDFELTANCKSASSVTFRFTGTPAQVTPHFSPIPDRLPGLRCGFTHVSAARRKPSATTAPARSLFPVIAQCCHLAPLITETARLAKARWPVRPP